MLAERAAFVCEAGRKRAPVVVGRRCNILGVRLRSPSVWPVPTTAHFLALCFGVTNKGLEAHEILSPVLLRVQKEK